MPARGLSTPYHQESLEETSVCIQHHQKIIEMGGLVRWAKSHFGTQSPLSLCMYVCQNNISGVCLANKFQPQRVHSFVTRSSFLSTGDVPLLETSQHFLSFNLKAIDSLSCTCVKFLETH